MLDVLTICAGTYDGKVYLMCLCWAATNIDYLCKYLG